MFRDPLHWLALRYKLALMFVGVCLLAFGLGGYLLSASARSALEGEIRSRLEFQARACATALDAELRTLESRLEDFASDGYIRRHAAALEEGGGDRGQLEAELLRHLRANKLPLVEAFASLRIVDPSGAVVIDSAEPAARGAAGAADGGIGDPATLCSGLLAPPAPDEAPRIVLSTPLEDLEGTSSLGRLCAEVRTGSWISRALAAEEIGHAGGETPVELRLVDGSGNLLIVSKERVALPSADSELARSGFGLVLAPASADAAERSDPDHGTFACSFPVRSNGWQAEVVLRAENALAAVSGLQSRFVLVGAVLALASVALLYFPLRFLTQSLGRLRDAAASIQQGDFTQRVEVSTEDELGELAQAFNLMAAAVEERTRRNENAARDLRAESERLSAVIASMRDGLVVLDPAGAPVLQNRAAEPLLRLLRKDGVATSHHNCRDGAQGASCRACLFDVQALPRSCVIEIEGGIYEVRSTRFAADAHGRSGRVLVSRDVSDRVAQDERQIHHERLAVLGEVAAVMAHELNNPLAAISMFNQMLAGEIDRASPLRENVDVIQRNVESCKRAIRELLDYANNAVPEILEVDVEATLEDVAAFLRPVRQRSNVEIATDFRARGAAVRGDEVQLRQIFVNLILNGVQACGGHPGRVLVRTAVEGDTVAVDVTDNGGGIPPEIQAQIFKPFFTTKPRGEGTGLGLPTARRIAEMHGGSLELVSSAPGSTTFRVRLRRSRGEAA
jgi:signal transduction histidine kinase